MYLAGILGLCALLQAPTLSARGSGSSFFALQDAQPAPAQSLPPEQAAPKSSPEQDRAKPDSAQSEVQQGKPEKSTPKKNPPSKKHAPGKKKKAPDPVAEDSKKTVVRHGSTAEPTTQLSPGITEEQAAHQRETTNQLLSSTDAALQKLDLNQLNTDQKETITQIRKFMEQAKAADAEGDPQRSYKLALKAHLLTDALGKQ
jgi:outer membrane biosynthesis protein TonB